MEEPIARLGRYVEQRRTELGLTQEEVNDQGGPSDTTISKLEGGAAAWPSRVTLQRLDVGLRWLPGSARHVLNGGEPEVDRPERTQLSEAFKDPDSPVSELAKLFDGVGRFTNRVSEIPELAPDAATLQQIATTLLGRALIALAPQGRSLSVAPDTTDDLIAADEQERSISGEQLESDLP